MRRREYQRWLDFELPWLAAYDGVWTMSEQDRGSAIRAAAIACGPSWFPTAWT